MKHLLPLLIFAIVSLACGLTELPFTETQSQFEYMPLPQAAPLPAKMDYATVTAYAVNVRDENGNKTGDFFTQGKILIGQIRGNWFVLSDGRRVWLGCTSSPSVYGCQSK